MMSQSFSNIRLSTGQDFMMIDNSHLPGISRLTETARRHSFDIREPNTAALTLQPNSVKENYTADAMGMEAFSTVSERLSAGVKDTSPLGNQMNTAEIGNVPQGLLGGSTWIADQQQSISENQGPLLPPSSNIFQNPDWSNIYNAGSLDQSNTSNFTFTTPTQSCFHSPALTATAQNRFQYGRLRPQTFAPGCTTPWQHSPPKRLSSLRQRSFSSPQPVNLGSQCLDVRPDSLPESVCGSTNTYQSHQVNQPITSCSATHRRSKRRHTTDILQDSGPRCKIHLTEEKIANHMKELSIHNISPPPESSSKTDEAYIDTGQSSDTQCGEASKSNVTELLKHSQRQWHDFRLLEDKLGIIEEDELSEEAIKLNEPSKPLLHLAGCIQIQPTPTMPQDIIDKIRNPCQEVVLWSPPNAGVSKLVPNRESVESDLVSEASDMMDASIDTDLLCIEVPLVTEKEMEAEPMDEMIEL